MDEIFDPEAKCLDVAEKIISCLNDGAIIERFKSIKGNIFNNYTLKPDIQAHLKTLSYENVELTNKLKELKNNNNISTNSSLFEYTLDVINGHINSTSPKPHTKQSSFESACSDLLDVLDARSKANGMIRQQLTDENSVLRDKISKAEAISNEESKESRQRRLDNDHKSRQKQKQISTKIAQIRTKIEQQSARYDDVIEENQEIDRSITEKINILSTTEEKLQSAEKRRAVAEKRLKDLQSALRRAETQAKTKEREVGSKRATQRFGIGDANENELETIRELEEEVSELYQENQAISLELKKRRLMMGNIDITEVSKI